ERPGGSQSSSLPTTVARLPTPFSGFTTVSTPPKRSSATATPEKLSLTADSPSAGRSAVTTRQLSMDTVENAPTYRPVSSMMMTTATKLKLKPKPKPSTNPTNRRIPAHTAPSKAVPTMLTPASRHQNPPCSPAKRSQTRLTGSTAS